MTWRYAARMVGIGLAIAAVLFVGWRVVQLRIWDHDIDFKRAAPFLAVLIPVYAMAMCLLAIAWTALIGNAVPLANGIRWYLTAQLGKYLPGNVAHLAGRHYMFAKAGVPQKTLLASAIVEAALLVATGVSIAALLMPRAALPLLDRYVSLSQWQWLGLVAAICVVILSACFMLLARYTKTGGKAKLLPPVLLYIAFFAISGSVLVGSLAASSPSAPPAHDWAGIIAACAAAWVAGFVIPGAPGGLGIRETVLVLLLSPQYGGDTALVAALLYRGVTLAGDALAALLGLALAGGRISCRGGSTGTGQG